MDLFWLILDAIGTFLWWVGMITILFICLFVAAIFGLIGLYSLGLEGSDENKKPTKHR